MPPKQGRLFCAWGGGGARRQCLLCELSTSAYSQHVQGLLVTVCNAAVHRGWQYYCPCWSSQSFVHQEGLLWKCLYCGKRTPAAFGLSHFRGPCRARLRRRRVLHGDTITSLLQETNMLGIFLVCFQFSRTRYSQGMSQRNISIKPGCFSFKVHMLGILVCGLCT